MKLNVSMFILICLLGAAVVMTLTGCPTDEPEVIHETIEELPEAAEEVYTDEPDEPATEELPGLEVEEMIDDTPPHVDDDEAEDDTAVEQDQPDAPPAPDADY